MFRELKAMPGRRIPGVSSRHVGLDRPPEEFLRRYARPTYTPNVFKINKKLRLHVIWDPVSENVSIKDSNAVVIGVRQKKSVYDFQDANSDVKFDRSLKATVDHVNVEKEVYQLGVWKGLKYKPPGILVDTDALDNSVVDWLVKNFVTTYHTTIPREDIDFRQSLAFCYLVAKLLKNYYAVVTGNEPSELDDSQEALVTVAFHDVISAPALISLRSDCFVDEMCCIYAVYRPFLTCAIPKSPAALEQLAKECRVHHIMKIEQEAVMLADRVCSFGNVSDKLLQRLLYRPINLKLTEKEKDKKRIPL